MHGYRSLVSDGARDPPAEHRAEFYGRPNSLVRAQYSLRTEGHSAGIVRLVRAGHARDQQFVLGGAGMARAYDARNEAVLRCRRPRQWKSGDPSAR